MGLAKGSLGALEVALQPADIADRVEAVGLRRRGVVARQLDRRALELALGAFPRAADRGDLGAMDPADARETRTSDCRSQYFSVASIHSLARR